MIVPEIGAVVILDATNCGSESVPLAASPIAVLLLLHAYVTVPDAVAHEGIIADGVIDPFIQAAAIAFIDIKGGFFTSTVFVVVVLPQEFVVVNFIL